MLPNENRRVNAFFYAHKHPFPHFSEKNQRIMHFFSSFRLCLMKNA